MDLRSEVDIGAPPVKVWQSVLALGEWWPHRHHEAGVVTLQPWPGWTRLTGVHRAFGPHRERHEQGRDDAPTAVKAHAEGAL